MILLVAGLLALHAALTLGRAWRAGRRAASQAAGDPSAEPPRPSVSILVPVWNDAGVVTGTLEALAAELRREHRPGDGPVQVAAIAGGSDASFDTTRAAFEALALPGPVLPQRGAGKNAALNAGLHATRGEVVVFLDADTSVEPGWLRALVAPIARGTADATTGAFAPFRRTAVSTVLEVDALVAQRVHRRGTLFGGGTIAVRRDLLEALGGLPEDVPVGVDWDLSARVSAAGGRTAYVADARVRTELPATWAEYLANELRWRRAYQAVEGRAGRARGLRAYVVLVQLAVLTGWAVLPAATWLAGLGGATGLALWGLGSAWVLARDAAGPVSAFALTGERRCLAAVPAHALAWLLGAYANLRALLTPRALAADFKGPRPALATETPTPRRDQR